MSTSDPQQPACTVLLVDHNRIFADVLAMRLREEPTVRAAVVADSVPEAMALLPVVEPDLLLVEYGVRGDLALRLMSEMAGVRTHASVVVLSDLRDESAVFAVLEAGARGWVSKDSTFATLWDGLREVRGGHMVLAPSVVEPVVAKALEAVRRGPRASRHDFVADLTPREFEVLQCLVAGMNRKEVASQLYVSVNTVRTHVQHLLKQAEVHTTLALVAAARDLGVTGVVDRRVVSPSFDGTRRKARRELPADP